MLTYHPKGKGHQTIKGWSDTVDFAYTDDYMKTVHMLIPQGNKFMLSEDFGFCARTTNIRSQEVELWVSHSHFHFFTKWHKVDLPLKKLSEHS